ncbi:ABC transporter substrate-binding protein [Agrobacterium tumefaciens]|uniref:ABC transporter substrate-binding protein n=1 Tax=Agrobacterium tumefaciens TaxID=358 RepID=UPI00097806F3|nr:ABC transporter substrate-binding protein [Agrobacterium tumefaciens]
MKNGLRMAAVAALMTLPGMALAETPHKGGTLTIALNSDIRSLDASRRDANTDTVLNHIFEQLVAYRDDLTVGPALADSWDVSADGVTYTFHLRPDVVYHNGDPVRAADVKWLWDRRMNTAGSDNPWVCIPNFNGSQGFKVVAVEAPDDKTVVFRLDQQSGMFLIRIASIACNVWAASPKNVGPDDKWIANSAIGSGPFRLKEWKKEQQIVLERFDGYKPSKAPGSGYSGARDVNIDTARFLLIPDKSSAETALLAGQVDVMQSVPATHMEDLKGKGAQIISSPSLSFTAIMVQTRDPLLSDVRLRRAIAHSIDLKQIAEVKTSGLADYNPSAVAQSSAYFREDFLDWPAYDPEAAKALLKEAGYKGQPIKIQTNTRYPGMYDNSVLIQAMLTSVGMNAQLDVLDWAAQLENFLSGKFQLQSFGFSPLADPSLRYSGLIGDKSKDASLQWENNEALALNIAAMKETDTEKRLELFKQIHALMVRDVPIFGLYYTPIVDAAAPKVRDYKVWAMDRVRAWDVWKAQ